ncbi:MAG: CHASE2 domain-containing protein [Candidatus Scalindua sp.]
MTHLLKPLILGLFIGILGLLISLVLFRLVLKENIDVDVLFNLRGPRQAPHDVIIVSMDKFSASKLNLPYDPKKWPRSLHARLTKNLSEAGAEVIAFDIMFNESRSTEDDKDFAEEIDKAGKIVLCESLKKGTSHLTDERGYLIGNIGIERLVQPIKLFADSAAALAPFPIPQVSTKISQYWTFKTSAGNVPTLPLVVFKIFTLNEYDAFIQLLKKFNPSQIHKLPNNKEEIIKERRVVEVIRILRNIFEHEPQIAGRMLEELHNSRLLSVDVSKKQILKSLISMYQGPKSQYINFYGPKGTITTVPYYQALNDKAKKGSEIFKGKAVFIGSAESLSPGQKDSFHTVFSKSGRLDISGVEIAATAFANLLEDIPVRPLSFHAYFGIIFLWGVVLGIYCYLFPAVISAVSVIGVSILYLLIALYQFKTNSIWYPLVVPVFCQAPTAFFGSIGYKCFNKNKERGRIREKIRLYDLPSEIVDDLSKSIVDITTRIQPVYGTCLYPDTVETMDPKERKRFIKKVVIDSVKKHEGSITNLKENPMSATWMSMHSDTDQRRQACLTALDIASHARPLPKIHIGLHSRDIKLLNNGAIAHEYYPVGKMIETATRIDELNKDLGTRILLSEKVLNQLDYLLTRELGVFQLDEHSDPIIVHELICLKKNSSQEQRDLCELFSKALDVFRNQSWEEAKDIFEEIIERYKEDGPSHFYKNKCEEYENKSFAPEWNGLIPMGRNIYAL